MATLLTTNSTTVKAGSTPNLTLDLYDTDGTVLTKSAITSVTLTVKDCAGNVINNRSSVDINDNDIGSLVDGDSTVTLTIKPTALDTAFQGTTDTVESHYWRVNWGWDDAAAVARIGGDIYEIKVERMPWG